ncbi:MAG: rRNA pseudouridine synthase [Gammaproteobacteria bacterium]|nr:rRNA pseudouridine synthase [Gammaproteobacteria bacterium]
MAWTSTPSAETDHTAISPAGRKHGIARTVSKLGLGSRNTAADWVRAGRIAVNGRVVRDPEYPVVIERDQLSLDGQPLVAAEKRYLMLNKPRGLVTTTADEQGRDTVYRCFENAGLPWLAPVGRLDKASEGLLLFSNDPGWAARITDPATGPDKSYHVQVDVQPDAALLAKLVAGIDAGGERLAAKSARLIRSGGKNAWLEIVLDEGRNRHIRRLLEAHDIGVLRLIRVAIGPLQLGTLAKGQWRWLEAHEYR